MAKRLSIFSPTIGSGLGKNVFGKDVANHSLFRALLLYGGLDQLDFLHPSGAPAQRLTASLIGDSPCPTVVTSNNQLAFDVARQSGALLRGSADLISLSWERRRRGATQDFSLMGLIHTTAPPSIREYIGQSLVAPVMPWDAIICTSPSVQTAMSNMFDDWRKYLGSRFDSKAVPAPMLPLLPLGVEATDFAKGPNSLGDRSSFRTELRVGDDEILVLWVGRLSFFEKAFPQPMMIAIEAAAKMSGKRVHFAMAGWFPDGAEGERLYRQAASLHAPNVQFHIVDGNDKQKLRKAWAGADVFISLVDNIQETFGITPLEAMASGLPVVVSDWDGYRYTVRDGIDGFLIPTLIGEPSAVTDSLAAQHYFNMKSYQQYVAITAQHTAVNIKIAAERLSDLFLSPDLRAKMGEAGRQRVASTFDWRVVAPQYVALAHELAAVRASASGGTDHADWLAGHHPSRSDPFHAFANFATHILSDDSVLSVSSDLDVDILETFRGSELTMFAANWHAAMPEMTTLVRALKDRGPMSQQEVIGMFPQNQHLGIKLAILWLAKMGVVHWE